MEDAALGIRVLEDTSQSTSDTRPQNRRNKCVLILEDDAGMAELQQRRLARLGFGRILVASDTTSARRLAEQGGIHLMLLDYKLQESITGLDFYRVLVESGISVPAILVTGLGYEKVLVESMQVGVRGFILKTENYWDDLCEVIARVERQLEIERAAVESERIKENEEKLEAAFAAASVGHWRWIQHEDVLILSPIHQNLLGVSSSALSCEEFLHCVYPEDRERVKQAFDGASSRNLAFEVEYRVQARSEERLRWLLSKGSPHLSLSKGGESTVTGITTDISARRHAEELVHESLAQISALNERLKSSMVETHHRVKNSLQIIGSLLNLALRGRDSLSIDEGKKLVSHIQSFAALHEILGERNPSDCQDMRNVSLRELLSRLIEALQPLCAGRLKVVALAEMRVSARQGSALGIILNELVSNALKYGDGTIECSLRALGQDEGALIVQNEGSAFPHDFSPESSGRTGLKLLCTIAKAELGRPVRFFNTKHEWAAVEVSFPLVD